MYIGMKVPIYNNYIYIQLNAYACTHVQYVRYAYWLCNHAGIYNVYVCIYVHNMYVHTYESKVLVDTQFIGHWVKDGWKIIDIFNIDGQ